MKMHALAGISIVLHAQDPVSRAGISSALARRCGITLIDDDTEAEIALVVAHEVDDAVQQDVRRLRRHGVDHVVLVVARVDDRGLFCAVEAGVSAILRRDEATPRRLEAAIRDVHQGNGNMPGDLLGRLMKQVNRLQDDVLAPQGMHLHGLRDREIEVLRLVSKGHTTCEIAERLAYSERTIKNVIQDVTHRLNLRNRSHAVAYAMRQGLI